LTGQSSLSTNLMFEHLQQTINTDI
jgi:hypothetical protein